MIVIIASIASTSYNAQKRPYNRLSPFRRYTICLKHKVPRMAVSAQLNAFYAMSLIVLCTVYWIYSPTIKYIEIYSSI